MGEILVRKKSFLMLIIVQVNHIKKVSTEGLKRKE